MADVHTTVWAWLGMIFGFVNKELRDLLKESGSPEELAEAIRKGEAELSSEASERLKANPFSSAEKKIAASEKAGISAAPYDSELYPEKLKELANAPAVIYYYGDIGLLKDRVVLDVVGARDCSEYSLRVCEMLCSRLIDRGALLATGFAMGIDQLVCSAAIAKASPPVVFYPFSLTKDYPQGCEKLKREAASAGVVLSEYGIGDRVVNGFLRRNILTVAMSDAVLFIEGGTKSHGLDHCLRARRSKKPVLVVPPCDIADHRYFGQIKLLRQGHRPLFSESDVVFALQRKGDTRLGTVEELAAEDRERPEEPRAVSRTRRAPKSAPAANKAPGIVSEEILGKLDEVPRRICEELMRSPLHQDDLSALLGVEAFALISELTELELAGIVCTGANGLYQIK